MSYDLKKESDVKEYLEKLGIEYRFGCYSEKKPEVCHLLGDYLEGIKKDFEKASKVYKSNCDDYGYAKSCYKYGNYSFLGKGKSGSKGDPKLAYQYYEKGCALNDPDACLHSGLLLVSRAMPKQIERNVPKGVEFLAKSCDMNNATACFYLSGMHISGVQKQENIESNSPQTKNPSKQTTSNVPKGGSIISDKEEYYIHKDMKKAFQFAYKACELRNMYACANLSQMYARGDGTEKNEEKAEKFKKMALEMQDEVKKQQQTLTFQQGILSQ
ncbi:cytochrome c oxidase assembly factor 7 homolog [Condylostylus longicornis]|uniref:cytochrome c oxidase assembly factor 7 homolog n=1 Tax=Condylostylus longicornis TaxID=2530218 RepID=UPI00244DDEE1|nr:cytochrome c oxidase assembly factor 7 homolog [Condylostylus longicornis]